MTGTQKPSERFGGIPALYREQPILITLSIIMFTNMMGFGMIVPIIPLYGRSFEVSSAMVGLLVTSFGLTRLIFNIPAGRLADRIGRRKLLLAGPLISSFGASLALFTPDFWLLMAALSIQGIGSAVYATAAMTMLADISNDQNRGRMMSLHQGSLLLGTSFGPSIGGLIGGSFGLSSVFLAAIVMYLLVTVLIFFHLPETLKPGSGGSGARRLGSAGPGALALLLNASFLAVSMVSIMVFFTRTGGRATVVPLRGAEELFMSTSMIGALLTVAALLNVIALPLAGWGIDRFGRKNMIVPSMIVSGVGVAIMAWAPNVTFLFIGIAIYGAGTGVAGPAPAAYVADLARGQNYGTVLGLFRSLSDSGFVLGPIMLGWMSDLRSFSFALYVNAFLMVLAGILFAVFAKEVRRSGEPIEPGDTDDDLGGQRTARHVTPG
jgi:MFS transporter, DHA1 family, multidrug resistance protein